VVAANTFDCDPNSILEETVAPDVPGWDSLSHPICGMSVEEDFGVEFDAAAVFEFTCIADLITAIEERAK
jgi:acyl carrier protein